MFNQPNKARCVLVLFILSSTIYAGFAQAMVIISDEERAAMRQRSLTPKPDVVAQNLVVSNHENDKTTQSLSEALLRTGPSGNQQPHAVTVTVDFVFLPRLSGDGRGF